MKRFALAGTITAVLALTLAFSACGGGDDDGGASGGSSSNIRTNQGLAVANLVAQLNAGAQSGLSAPGTAAPEAVQNASITSRSADRNSAADSAYGYGYAPAFQTAGGAGISASGYGSATATADSAIIDFYFYNYGGDVIPVPEPANPSSPLTSDDKPLPIPGTVAPITEADLQPVIDALNAAGASDVEFIGQSYYDSYSASATLHATVDDVDMVEAVVQAGTDVSANLANGITFSGSNVSYTLQDCAALEQAAMAAAVDDAHRRAGVLAGVLEVTLGNVIGASDSSYSPYGSAPCSSSYSGPIPVLDSRGAVQGAASAGEVQVFSSVSVTYSIN